MVVVQDLFSATNVTVEDVLSFGEINRTSYSVGQKDGKMHHFVIKYCFDLVL